MVKKLHARKLRRLLRMLPGHAHAYVIDGGTTYEGKTRVEERFCRCGARRVVRTTELPVRHNCCPECGGVVRYDPTALKTCVGTDVYCDENVYGEWRCETCGKFGDEDFSGDFVPTKVETSYFDE